MYTHWASVSCYYQGVIAMSVPMQTMLFLKMFFLNIESRQMLYIFLSLYSLIFCCNKNRTDIMSVISPSPHSICGFTPVPFPCDLLCRLQTAVSLQQSLPISGLHGAPFQEFCNHTLTLLYPCVLIYIQCHVLKWSLFQYQINHLEIKSICGTI